MDPISVSAATAAVMALGVECAKGMATEVGKNAWEKIVSLLGIKANSSDGKPDLSTIPERLNSNPQHLVAVEEILKSMEHPASGLVQKVVAGKAVTAQTINVQGNFNA